MRTLQEIEAFPKEMLTAEQIAPILGADVHSIRLQAHADPKALGFPVIVINRRVKIPRQGFLNFCRAYGIGT